MITYNETNFLITQENQKDFLGPENQRFSWETSLNKELTFLRKVKSKTIFIINLNVDKII